MIDRLVAAAAGLFALSGMQSAAPPSPEQLWQQLTIADVEAARRLLAEDHPGVLEEVGDADFRRRLEAGYRTALARAGRVDGLAGYLATMQGFAHEMGDKHIASRPLATPVTVNWAGLLLARRGGAWVVGAEENAADAPPLGGAALLSCDGTPVDALAEQRLGGFRAVWSIDAQRIAAAPWLLVDDGNPFLTRPTRCIFEQGSVRREIALRWRASRRAEVTARMGQLPRAAPGMGVRQSGAGWWIALQTLGGGAQQVVAAVRAQADAMRRAPFVVLDLRGNSGGNSAFGQEIAEAILGPAARLEAGGEESEQCNPVWRISERNLRLLEEIAREAPQRMGEQAAAFWASQHRRAVEGRAAGRALTGAPVCGRQAVATRGPSQRPAFDFQGRLFVLTDHVCFSSCLLVTDRWRQLGAIHIGEATDAATRYFEVREERMPSNLSSFSTLQALSPTSPPQIGPFVPHRPYDGDIADTAALEAWVAGIAATAR